VCVCVRVDEEGGVSGGGGKEHRVGIWGGRDADEGGMGEEVRRHMGAVVGRKGGGQGINDRVC